MGNTRVLTNKFYGWFFAPATAVEDINAITATEAAEFKNISDAAKFDNWNFNTKASTSTDDRSFADAAGAKTAGDADFGGSGSFFKAKDGDTTSSYHDAQVGIKPAGTDIILLARPALAVSTALAAGQEYRAWHVLTDAPADVRGDTSYSYTSSLLPQSDVCVDGIIAPATAVAVTVAVAAGSLTGAPGDIARLKATYQSNIVTIGATWTSSDPSIATVTEHGVVEMIADGTCTITAGYPGATDSTDQTVTVSTP